jgi:hypothetical protein
MEPITWSDFAPRGNWPGQEPLESYLIRIRLNPQFDHIPDNVFAQWLYLHHQNEQSLKNYAWLDFVRIRFTMQSWTVAELQKLKLIELFQNTIEEIDSPFQRVCASRQDKEVWAKQGTWRVPPIVLDVPSVAAFAPTQAELNGHFQLVEGHSRYRNLLISDYQQLPLAITHQVYLMQYC